MVTHTGNPTRGAKIIHPAIGGRRRRLCGSDPGGLPGKAWDIGELRVPVMAADSAVFACFFNDAEGGGIGESRERTHKAPSEEFAAHDFGTHSGGDSDATTFLCGAHELCVGFGVALALEQDVENDGLCTEGSEALDEAPMKGAVPRSRA